jgi:aspartate/tyrosine/aromatic aminotransferase
MYDQKTNGLAMDSLVEGIKKLPKGSWVLLQTCGNNPTGVDMTEKDWVAMSKLIKDEGKRVILDSAYIGFISGSLYKDSYPIRIFAEDKHNFLAIQSYSKNMGLYGERLGLLHGAGSDRHEAARLVKEFS